ncbi:hypothetical protein ACFL1X_03800 [Candidatus Hydrogenedentota bacterium]
MPELEARCSRCGQPAISYRHKLCVDCASQLNRKGTKILRELEEEVKNMSQSGEKGGFLWHMMTTKVWPTQTSAGCLTENAEMEQARCASGRRQ